VAARCARRPTASTPGRLVSSRCAPAQRPLRVRVVGAQRRTRPDESLSLERPGSRRATSAGLAPVNGEGFTWRIFCFCTGRCDQIATPLVPSPSLPAPTYLRPRVELDRGCASDAADQVADMVCAMAVGGISMWPASQFRQKTLRLAAEAPPHDGDLFVARRGCASMAGGAGKYHGRRLEAR